ncbi:hypothetical protein GCK72_021376 [Caenorhabditis remanei]|uniref:DUF38 domain-containing protein n=1 Tax=Caenorhabditis remanei TaxID=31234 RepID=A0A6A5GJY1_CAERE|nr:hypothetical protein GCK72_021376 [Caenorhabditis remanei]KAF1754812.1 hypothetical protein GCK72_021376 [Caenorhabditis remanei]
MTLRKTSHLLRNFIDDNRIRTPTTSTIIQLTFNQNSIQMMLKIGENQKPVFLTYSNHENGCELSYRNSKKILEMSDYLKIFETDFQLVLSHQNSKNSRLEFLISRRIFSLNENILEMLRRTVPMKVQDLTLHVSAEIQVSDFLNLIESSHLTSLTVVGTNIDESQLENLNSLKKLQIGNSITDIPLARLTNLEEVIIKYRFVKFEDVLFLKELFCTGPLDDKNSFSINLTGGSPNRKELTATLSPLTDEVDHWYYRAAINSEKLLFIGLGARWLRFS